MGNVRFLRFIHKSLISSVVNLYFLRGANVKQCSLKLLIFLICWKEFKTKCSALFPLGQKLYFETICKTKMRDDRTFLWFRTSLLQFGASENKRGTLCPFTGQRAHPRPHEAPFLLARTKNGTSTEQPAIFRVL